MQIVAACNDSGVLNPLQAAREFFGGSFFLDERVLEFFVFLGELVRNGIKTFPDANLVGRRSVLDHIVAIRIDNGFLQLEHGVHLVGVYEFLHDFGHATHNGVLQ